MRTLRSDRKTGRQPPWGRLAVHDHGPLPILAIFLNSRNRFWSFEFPFFDECCLLVRLQTELGRSHGVGRSRGVGVV